MSWEHITTAPLKVQDFVLQSTKLSSMLSCSGYSEAFCHLLRGSLVWDCHGTQRNVYGWAAVCPTRWVSVLERENLSLWERGLKKKNIRKMWNCGFCILCHNNEGQPENVIVCCSNLPSLWLWPFGNNHFDKPFSNPSSEAKSHQILMFFLFSFSLFLFSALPSHGDGGRNSILCVGWNVTWTVCSLQKK